MDRLNLLQFKNYRNDIQHVHLICLSTLFLRTWKLNKLHYHRKNVASSLGSSF